MEFVKNNSVLQLILMYTMIVVSTVIILFELLFTALKEGIWSLFHVSVRIQPPEKARSKRYGTHGFASFQVETRLCYILSKTESVFITLVRDQ